MRDDPARFQSGARPGAPLSCGAAEPIRRGFVARRGDTRGEAVCLARRGARHLCLSTARVGTPDRDRRRSTIPRARRQSAEGSAMPASRFQGTCAIRTSTSSARRSPRVCDCPASRSTCRRSSPGSACRCTSRAVYHAVLTTVALVPSRERRSCSPVAHSPARGRVSSTRRPCFAHVGEPWISYFTPVDLEAVSGPTACPVCSFLSSGRMAFARCYAGRRTASSRRHALDIGQSGRPEKPRSDLIRQLSPVARVSPTV